MLICFGQEGNFFLSGSGCSGSDSGSRFYFGSGFGKSLHFDLLWYCHTLFLCYFRQIIWSAMSVLGRANLKSLTNQLSENNINVRTQVKISTDDSLEEVSRESILLQDGYFRSPVTDYNMDKVNYPENTLFYINWLFKTVIS